MYCVKCGVKLADTEARCPLCNTVVFHPELEREPAQPLYPENRYPKNKGTSKAFHGVILILFFIPMLIAVMTNWQLEHQLSWYGIAVGGIALIYVIFALPFWFRNPNPVIFAPCSFGAIALYLWYINWYVAGSWFWSFALPITAALGLIVCAVITLSRYLKKGKLYIAGGAFMAFGAFLLLVEFLLAVTFGVDFIGWSIYPLIVLVLFGGALVYLAINRAARETLERKLFF
ncbi:MAG: hypothetical protein E7486_04845 [Ruminococcaceae bacterium]|nr:hypothetical protein [Oscillospiraceae bacterium]